MDWSSPFGEGTGKRIARGTERASSHPTHFSWACTLHSLCRQVPGSKSRSPHLQQRRAATQAGIARVVTTNSDGLHTVPDP
eukprot:291001-Chlamydomonas_euryale.AAC.1